MRVCVAGACGRMGRRILELLIQEADMNLGGAFDLPEDAGREIAVGHESGQPQSVTLAADAASALEHADVLIDFTVAQACVPNVLAAAKQNKPAVVGTTGLSDPQQQELARAAQSVPIIYAPNMSVGVNLLFKLTRDVARTLGLDYNVEIVEVHHNQKKDSPSGTAVRLGECAAGGLDLDYGSEAVHGREGMVGARPKREIGLHAVRGGDVVGEHTVAFIGQGERIELVHKAHNRDNFARGALRAARFAMTAAPGLYDMQDVLGLK